MEQLEFVKRTRRGAKERAQRKRQMNRYERQQGKRLQEDAPKRRQFKGYEY
jgi:hypothetical protein